MSVAYVYLIREESYLFENQHVYHANCQLARECVNGSRVLPGFAQHSELIVLQQIDPDRCPHITAEISRVFGNLFKEVAPQQYRGDPFTMRSTLSWILSPQTEIRFPHFHSQNTHDTKLGFIYLLYNQLSKSWKVGKTSQIPNLRFQRLCNRDFKNCEIAYLVQIARHSSNALWCKNLQEIEQSITQNFKDGNRESVISGINEQINFHCVHQYYAKNEPFVKNVPTIDTPVLAFLAWITDPKRNFPPVIRLPQKGLYELVVKGGFKPVLWSEKKTISEYSRNLIKFETRGVLFYHFSSDLVYELDLPLLRSQIPSPGL